MDDMTFTIYEIIWSQASSAVADLPEEVFMERIEVAPLQPAHQPSTSMKKVVNL